MFNNGFFKMVLNRVTSRIMLPAARISPSSKLYSQRKDIFKKELAIATEHFPKFVDRLCSFDFLQEIPGFTERYKTLLNYAVNNNDSEKMVSILLTLYTYRRLQKPENLTPDNLEKACAAGWAIRMIEAGQIILDDIADNSDTRYNKPSWKMKEGVARALVDSHWLNFAASFLLQHYLADHPQLSNIVRLHNYYVMKVCTGQVLDVTKVKGPEDVNWLKYRSNKTCYILDGPVRTALYLSNIEDEDYHEKVREILVAGGLFATVQNDYWGAYSTYEHLKTGCSDIPNGTNTWLFSKAVELSDPAQRKVLLDNYGKANEESIKKVTDIYHSLKLDAVYEDHLEQLLADLHGKIEKLPTELPKQLLHDVVDLLPKGVINV